MAFASRIVSILKQARSKQINIESSVSNLSLYQAVRCMSTKLFVGGLPYGTDEASLRQVFSQYGEVDDVRIISDRDTGRSRGFGFVSFFSSEDASTAMRSMDGQAIQGRTVRVNIAADKPRAGGFGGGGGYGGGSYGGGSGGNYGGNHGGSGYGGNHGGGGSYGGNYGGDGGGGGYRGGSSSNAGGYGNYGSGGVGSYTGGNSGGYGGVSSSGNFGLAGGSDYTEAKYGDRMGIGGVNESFSQDPPEGKDKDDNGEPDEFANTRG